MRLSEDEVRARVRGLPPLPRVVHELRAALSDPSTSTERIVSLVATEPALTTATLRLANSSFYGVSGRIATLNDAVRMLGVDTLGGVVTTAAVLSVFNRVECPGFDLEGSQRHAVATAVAARIVADDRDLDGDLGYTVGLLHDIGRLALAAAFPRALSAVIARVGDLDMLPADVERELLGIDHARVGAMLAAHWKLPPVVVETIGRHHDASLQGRGPLDDVLHLADAVTYALGLSTLPDEPVPPLSAEAWERLGLTPTELDPLFARIEARMRAFAPDRLAA